MCENVDFILLPEEAWQLLVKWYTGGPEIKRQVVTGPDEQIYVDLYPWIVILQLKDSTGRPKPGTSWQLVIPGSKSTLAEFYPLIAETTKLQNIKSLWYKSGSDWAKMDTTSHVSLTNGSILIDTIGGDPPTGD